MSKSRGIALCGALFALIGIKAVAHHELVPSAATFALAIACGVRARVEWIEEHTSRVKSGRTARQRAQLAVILGQHTRYC